MHSSDRKGRRTRIPGLPASQARYVLSFQKVDAATRKGLPDASFALCKNGEQIMEATSGPAGCVRFAGVAPGLYSLMETVAPPGYQRQRLWYRIFIDDTGHVWLNRTPVSFFSLENHKSERSEDAAQATSCLKANAESETLVADRSTAETEPE